MKRILICLAGALAGAPAASADNVALCEALTVRLITSDEDQGQAQMASYHPAVDFLTSLYDEDEGHLKEINDLPIRAIMCRRNNVIPSETDYEILATGLPFVLSQNFDSTETDSLTVFWKENALDYVYKGRPLSDEAQEILDARLAEFTARGKHEAPAEAAESGEEIDVDDVEIDLDTDTSDFMDDGELSETAHDVVQSGPESAK